MCLMSHKHIWWMCQMPISSQVLGKWYIADDYESFLLCWMRMVKIHLIKFHSSVLRKKFENLDSSKISHGENRPSRMNSNNPRPSFHGRQHDYRPASSLILIRSQSLSWLANKEIRQFWQKIAPISIYNGHPVAP